MRTLIIVAVLTVHKCFLNQRQQGCVVARSVANIVWLGERRDGQEGNAEAKLVKVRALRWKRTCWIGSQRRAELYCITPADLSNPPASLQPGGGLDKSAH